MTRTFGSLLAGGALVLLAACGSQSSSTATGGSTPDPNSTVDATQIALLSQTGGRGHADPIATPLGTQGEIDAFTDGLAAPLVHRITKALAKASPPDGTRLMGAVVAVGCDVPPGVDVTHGTDQVQVVPREVASPLPECLAPVTTVAIVAVPNA